MGCCVIYHERCYAQLFSCSKERCFARANYGAQGVKSKTLSKQVFFDRKLLCSIWRSSWLLGSKAIFRALASVHYLQFCDSGAFHLTRCSTKKCVDLGHIFVIFRNVRTLSWVYVLSSQFSQAYEEILLSIFQSLKSLKNLDDGKNGCLLEGRSRNFSI